MSDYVVTTLAVLHVLSAISWLGGATLFVSVIAPGLKTLSPQSTLEFLVKLEAKVTRFFLGASTATVIFGLGLFFASGVDNNAIWIGLSLGLVAYIVAIGVTVPAFNKVDKLAHQMVAQPQAGPPPAEFTAALKRGGMAATIVVVLLAIAAIFMVISGFAY